MTEQECSAKMVAPGEHRPGKYREGVIQIWITRSCDKACYGCTQGSNLSGHSQMITPAQFQKACESLEGYFGVIGIFGGNPTLHPQFDILCKILAEHFPYEQRGLWSNRAMGKIATIRETFNPAVSNINVHLDKDAYDEFRDNWPNCFPIGLNQDSRHSPPYVAMQDLIEDEGQRWELISNCDINQHWSAMIGVFRGELRAWFCEIAGAQSILHQHEPDYPDIGTPVLKDWWKLPIEAFQYQIKLHCHACGVPLRGYGELSQAKDGTEQTTKTHANVYKPKVATRKVQIVEDLAELGKPVPRFIDYLQNAKS